MPPGKQGQFAKDFFKSRGRILPKSFSAPPHSFPLSALIFLIAIRLPDCGKKAVADKQTSQLK
jgi:hypothetical protein